MTIMVFFLCLYKLRLITAADCDHVVLHGFVEYIKTMRCLQNTYLLEPAGSHGAWVLSDMFRGLRLYTAVVIFYIYWCARKLWSSSIILYDRISTAQHHHTNNNP